MTTKELFQRALPLHAVASVLSLLLLWLHLPWTDWLDWALSALIGLAAYFVVGVKGYFPGRTTLEVDTWDVDSRPFEWCDRVMLSLPVVYAGALFCVAQWMPEQIAKAAWLLMPLALQTGHYASGLIFHRRRLRGRRHQDQR